MRVLYVIDSLAASGGAEQGLLAEAPGLAGLGVDRVVQPLAERPGVAEDLRRQGVDVLAAPEGGRRDVVRRLRARIDEVRPDLVHTVLYESNVLGRIAGRRARVPVVSSLVNVMYGREVVSRIPAWKVRATQAADVATARTVRRFHALTATVADTMAGRLHVPRDLIDVIPRGRDPGLLGERSEQRRAEVRAQLGLPPEAAMILVVGRHEYQKGIDVAIRAYDRIVAGGAKAVLLVAGRTGRETARLADLVSDLGVDEGVRFLGVRRDVADLMAASDVLLFPSRWEGLGSVLLEGMALGTPIVAAAAPAIVETVQGTAAIVPADDVAATADALSEVLDPANAAEVAARAGSGQARFRSVYALDVVVPQIAAFYERALAQA